MGWLFIVAILFILLLYFIKKHGKEDDTEEVTRIRRNITRNNFEKNESSPRNISTHDQRIIDRAMGWNDPDDGIFEDNSIKPRKDYSHLSSKEAQQLLNQRKAKGEFIPDDEYFGLIDAIATINDDKFFEEIKNKTPEEIRIWFDQNRRYDINMSYKIWRTVSGILAPYYEDFLLNEMEKKTTNTISGFVRARKHEGYFFTEKGFEKARDIYSGRYDPSTARKEANRPITYLRHNIRKYEKMYNEASKQGDMAKMNKAKVKIQMYKEQLDQLTRK